MIANKSEGLTFRDFKKAERVSSKLKVSISLLEDAHISNLTDKSITFASYTALQGYLKGPSYVFDEQVVLILDEFDSVAFSPADDIMTLKNDLKHFKTIIGFTGSDLKDFH